MNVDIWDQASTNQGALTAMALLLVLIAMSVATFAQRISNRKVKAAIDDLGARETIIRTLEPRYDRELFQRIGKRH
jgi:deoxyadenosine/deoxycytidine kinase